MLQEQTRRVDRRGLLRERHSQTPPSILLRPWRHCPVHRSRTLSSAKGVEEPFAKMVIALVDSILTLVDLKRKDFPYRLVVANESTSKVDKDIPSLSLE